MSTPGDADPHSKTISVTDLASVTPAPQGSVVPAPQGTLSEGPPVIAGRYELLGMLGAGAMGTVYRARDRELDEVVALKILKKEIASTEMIERFRREVKLARRVTHKNVARTYDIGEHEGDRYLTMELIEGEMLGAMLARRKRLPIPEVIEIALDICAGLGAAHAANVLHRDLKPENVIVAKEPAKSTERRGAVITDFGIARAAAESREQLSQTMGGIVGTPAYMAPEQVEGSTDLDARADLYAFGTMLYELVTGELAWSGDSIVTVAAGRLLRPPPDPRAVMPSVPAPLAAIILKLMARHREDRFASAEELAAAIVSYRDGGSRALDASPPTTEGSASVPPRAKTGTIPLAPPRPVLQSAPSSGTLPIAPLIKPRAPGARVLAMLPVLNLGSKDDDYLVDSVNEDIVDSLSVVPSLLVRPRGETMKYIDPKRDVREIGRALGVDVVIDASVRRIGETVRASFRLITVEDGFQLWARRFDRPPSEILSIADEAAHAIASALTTEITAPKAVRVADAQAEEMYLRGRYFLRRAWHGTLQDAVNMLAQAAERAPDDARIIGTYALSLARTYGGEGFGRDVAERARALSLRASEIDSKNPEARVALAIIHLMNGEGDAAIGYLREALVVAPNSVDALDWLGRVAGEVDRVKDAVQLLERVIEIEPEAVAAHFQIARILSMSGDRAAARKRLADNKPTDPSDLAGWMLTCARDALWYRDHDSARQLIAELDASALPPLVRFPLRAMLDITLGDVARLVDRELLDKVLPIDLSRPPRRASFNAQMRTELLVSAGLPERAIEAVAAADGNGLIDVVWLLRCPLLEPLRSNPTFAVLQARVKLRAERVAAAFVSRLDASPSVDPSASIFETLTGKKTL